MIPETFASTGIHARKRGDTSIRRFQVLGERSCGTNFVKRLLGRNTDLKPTEALGWKHGFPHAAAIPGDLAVIACVRHAEAWALSMHAKPWHTTPAMQRLEFGTFMRAPWDTVVDRPRYFERTALPETLGRVLQYDRHPVTGARFDNLFALRRAKLQGLLSYLARDCTVILLRMEEAQRAPEATVDAILEGLGVAARSTDFAPVRKRLGSRFKPSVDARPKTPKAIGKAGLRFMCAELDLEMEAALGYNYPAASTPTTA